MKSGNIRHPLELALVLGVLAAINCPSDTCLFFGIPAAGLVVFAVSQWISE